MRPRSLCLALAASAVFSAAKTASALALQTSSPTAYLEESEGKVYVVASTTLTIDTIVDVKWQGWREITGSGKAVALQVATKC